MRGVNGSAGDVSDVSGLTEGTLDLDASARRAAALTSGTARITRPESIGAMPMPPILPISVPGLPPLAASVSAPTSPSREARVSKPFSLRRSRMMRNESREAYLAVGTFWVSSSSSCTMVSTSISWPATLTLCFLRMSPYSRTCSWICKTTS
jgi:hypothetical protein